METLRFKEDDFQFIKEKYPNLYSEFKDTCCKNGIIYVPMPTKADYDYYFDIVGDYIATSLDKSGELSEDGLRLESAWDYADWSRD